VESLYLSGHPKWEGESPEWTGLTVKNLGWHKLASSFECWMWGGV
jgi:hypothetical protein